MVYECYFSSVESTINYNIVELICKGNFNLSFEFFTKFAGIDSFDYREEWISFKLSKQFFLDLNYEDLNEDDLWFIRTVNDCFNCGSEIIHIDMWKHIYVYFSQ